MSSLSEKLFVYPAKPHSHRHGPMGYKNYEEYKPWLRDEFLFTCAYCLVRERWQRGGQHHFSVEHVNPQVAAPGLAAVYSNLIYACVDCNSLRQDRPVLNPFSNAFADHVRIGADGLIRGLTPTGIAHIKVLLLDSEQLTKYRQQILQTVGLIEQNSHRDAQALLRQWLGFPDDLPNLAAKRPPRRKHLSLNGAELLFSAKATGKTTPLVLKENRAFQGTVFFCQRGKSVLERPEAIGEKVPENYHSGGSQQCAIE